MSHAPLMQRLHPYQSYRAVATQTATPGQLILMLFDGAIRFLEQARLGFTQDDPLEFNRTINNNLQRAQAIINELNESLDMQAGGQFAATMRGLYHYMDHRLHESNRQKKDDGILDVLHRLTTLRDAWAEMLGKQNASATGDTVVRLSAAA